MASKTEILKKSKQREKKINTARHILGVVIAFLIVGAFWFLINCSFLRVTKFVVMGTTFENKSLIEQKAGEALTGSYYFIVPKNSVFFYQEKSVLNYLKKSFPRLADIEIMAPELNALKITVSDKKPKLIWCEGMASDKKCFYLDESGRTYSEAPSFSENIIFELAGYHLGDKIGQKALTSDRIENISNFLIFLTNILPSFQKDETALKILQTKVLPDGDFSVEIGFSSGSSVLFKILFNADRQTEDLINNLTSILKNETFLTELKNKEQKLEYLDLRFGQKVFYRFI